MHAAARLKILLSRWIKLFESGVCVCVWIPVGVYTCECVWTRLCVYMYASIYMYTCGLVYMWVCVYVYVCIYVRTHVSPRRCVHVH